MPQSPPQSVPAELLVQTLRDCGVTIAVTVPDTHQRTLLAQLAKDHRIRLLTCSTEDEACAVAAGLWIGGEEPVLIIQHAGLYASVNTLRGVAIDGRIPTFYLIGLLSREPDRLPGASARSMVRFCEPLLDVFDVPHVLIDGPDDVPEVPRLFRLSRERRGPTAALIGMPTC
ncbi:MAG: thiamine pyrophosphate-binding protein [Chloroflexota bacterium]